MAIQYQCPVCQQALHTHQESSGFYCDNKHRFDRHENGYWVFALPKQGKGKQDSRQLMRAKRHLLTSGLLSPVVDAMATCVSPLLVQSSLQQLTLNCGEGYFVRQLAHSLTSPEMQALNVQNHGLQQTAMSEAENAVFAAVKSDTDAFYLLGGDKRLPFADESFDLITLVNTALKGKESLRVLKSQGHLLYVSFGPRHLWQVKSVLYADMAEKAMQVDLPSGLEVVTQQRVQFQHDASSETALTLLEMTPYAWRVNDKMKRQLMSQVYAGLELDFVVTLAKKIS